MQDKERSRTNRSYLIRHQSSLPLLTTIQVNYLDLGRICSSARKWLFFFFGPVGGPPILDHVVLFCRLVLGARGVSAAGRDRLVHAHLPPRRRARAFRFYLLFVFLIQLPIRESAKQLRTRTRTQTRTRTRTRLLPVFFFFSSGIIDESQAAQASRPSRGPEHGRSAQGGRAPACMSSNVFLKYTHKNY